MTTERCPGRRPEALKAAPPPLCSFSLPPCYSQLSLLAALRSQLLCAPAVLLCLTVSYIVQCHANWTAQHRRSGQSDAMQALWVWASALALALAAAATCAAQQPHRLAVLLAVVLQAGRRAGRRAAMRARTQAGTTAAMRATHGMLAGPSTRAAAPPAGIHAAQPAASQACPSHQYAPVPRPHG